MIGPIITIAAVSTLCAVVEKAAMKDSTKEMIRAVGFGICAVTAVSCIIRVIHEFKTVR